MPVEIDIVDMTAQPTLVVRCQSRHPIGATLVGALDKIYGLLRPRGIASGLNIAVYYGTKDGVVDFESGVLIDDPIGGDGEIYRASTPTGRAVHAVHWGEYGRIPETTMQAMQAIRDRGLKLSGASWEVYGHHHDDWAKNRTDLYFLLAPEGA